MRWLNVQHTTMLNEQKLHRKTALTRQVVLMYSVIGFEGIKLWYCLSICRF